MAEKQISANYRREIQHCKRDKKEEEVRRRSSGFAVGRATDNDCSSKNVKNQYNENGMQNVENGRLDAGQQGYCLGKGEQDIGKGRQDIRKEGLEVGKGVYKTKGRHDVGKGRHDLEKVEHSLGKAGHGVGKVGHDIAKERDDVGKREHKRKENAQGEGRSGHGEAKERDRVGKGGHNKENGEHGVAQGGYDVEKELYSIGKVEYNVVNGGKERQDIGNRGDDNRIGGHYVEEDGYDVEKGELDKEKGRLHEKKERLDDGKGGDDVEKRGKSPSFKIIIMNVNGRSDGKSNVSGRRKEVIRKVLSDLKPAVLFIQEFLWECSSLIIREIQPIYHYNGQKNQASIIHDTNLFTMEELGVDLLKTIEKALEDLQEVSSNQPNETSSRSSRILPRMLIKRLSSAAVSVICISWHGMHNRMSRESKINSFKLFIEFCRGIRQKTKLPILIGGDFNISMQFIKEYVTEPFELHEYTPSPRRHISEIIDFYITTDKLCLREIKPFDLSTICPELNPNGIFDHDPIYAELSNE